MTKAYINFDQNYNGKLGCQYFTTIRSVETITEKDLCIGDLVDVQKDHFTMFSAEIVNIDRMDLDHLTKSQRTLITLDCGCYWIQAVDSLKQICKSNIVAVITLMKQNEIRKD